MSSLPTITRKPIANGKAYRYENATTGSVVTARSKRLYEFASAYRVTTRLAGYEPVTVERPTQTARDRALVAEYGPTYESRREVYEAVPEAEQQVVIYLHARADLAAKGSSDANRIPGFVRIPGVIEIQEA